MSFAKQRCAEEWQASGQARSGEVNGSDGPGGPSPGPERWAVVCLAVAGSGVARIKQYLKLARRAEIRRALDWLGRLRCGWLRRGFGWVGFGSGQVSRGLARNGVEIKEESYGRGMYLY